MPMNEEKIRKSLQTQIIGTKIHLFDHLSSTNKWAMTRLVEGAENGELVLAERQSEGKGRLGHTWYSPPGGGLYLSIILHPNLDSAQIYRLTLVAGAACSEALSKLSGEEIHLKWPNDLYAKDRKLGGILCEARIQGDKLTGAVIGIGVNIHLDRKKLPSELESLAISLADLADREWNREEVAAAILNDLEKWYNRLKSGQWSEIVAFCDEKNILKGRQVEVISAGETFNGEVKGLSKEGHLILRLDSGEERHFFEGDTTLSCS